MPLALPLIHRISELQVLSSSHPGISATYLFASFICASLRLSRSCPLVGCGTDSSYCCLPVQDRYHVIAFLRLVRTKSLGTSSPQIISTILHSIPAIPI